MYLRSSIIDVKVNSYDYFSWRLIKLSLWPLEDSFNIINSSAIVNSQYIQLNLVD